MEAFLAQTGLLAIVFIVLHYIVNKNNKTDFFTVLFGAIAAALIATVIFKAMFHDGSGIGTNEAPTKQ